MVDEGAKSFRQVLVVDLGLAVSLRVVRCQEYNLGSQDFVKLILKGSYKLRTPVRSRGVRRAEVAVNMVDVEAGYLNCSS